MHVSRKPFSASGQHGTGTRLPQIYTIPTFTKTQCIRGSLKATAHTGVETIETAQGHAQQIMEHCKRHDLEALIPYMSELDVVKAVVRQHQQQQAWKQREARRSDMGYSASSIYDSYDSWHPSRPICPVPGASPSSLSPVSPMDSTDYAWDGRAYMDGVPMPWSQPAVATPDFTAILDAAQRGDTEHQLLDSYAMRHLVLSRPSELVPLSCMMLSPQLFLQRCQSTSLWGEKVVLNITLKLRSEQELRSGYSKHPVKQPWILSRVVGEPVSSEPLEAISPEHPPEAVVAAQVQAFKDCDFDVAYALTSPVGRAVAGTRDRFKAAMQGDFRYQPILAHKSATSLHQTHSSASTYLEVFNIQSHAGSSSLFIWVAVRQLEGLYKNCWLVEYVTPIKDPDFVKALQAGI